MCYRRRGPPFEHMTRAHVFIAQMNYQILHKSSGGFFPFRCMYINVLLPVACSSGTSDSSIISISISSRSRAIPLCRCVTMSSIKSNQIDVRRVSHNFSVRCVLAVPLPKYTPQLDAHIDGAILCVCAIPFCCYFLHAVWIAERDSSSAYSSYSGTISGRTLSVSHKLVQLRAFLLSV